MTATVRCGHMLSAKVSYFISNKEFSINKPESDYTNVLSAKAAEQNTCGAFWQSFPAEQGCPCAAPLQHGQAREGAQGTGRNAPAIHRGEMQQVNTWTVLSSEKETRPSCGGRTGMKRC